LNTVITRANDTDNNDPSSLHTFCDRCKDGLAEIFQVNGDYCLARWQELTYPNL
jgi:hypothetical protein